MGDTGVRSQPVSRSLPHSLQRNAAALSLKRFMAPRKSVKNLFFSAASADRRLMHGGLFLFDLGAADHDLAVGLTVVAIFVYLSRRKRRRVTGAAGRSSSRGARVAATARSPVCLYCGEPVGPRDTRCPACGYATIDRPAQEEP